MIHDLKTRREFLEFMGLSAAAVGLSGTAASLLSSCASNPTAPAVLAAPPPFEPVAASSADTLGLANGFNAKILLRWDDALNNKGDFWGANNDYLAFFRLNEEGTDGILWSNHESYVPMFVSGRKRGSVATRSQILKEQLSVGGSLVRIKKDPATGEWALVKNDPHNRRLTGQTKIPIISERPIMGSKVAVGTFGNCAGGITPWGTVLTAEENTDDFYGTAVYDEKGKRTIEESVFGWEKFFNYPPEHYGWIVEVNPLTGAAKKLTSIGRYAHECATIRVAKDGRCVVYSGDDGNDRCLYKFIADKPGSLETGKLYAADVANGKWISLSIKDQPKLKAAFKDQTEVLIRCREAAPMVGASALARPEDIEIDPQTGSVYITLTNNQPKGNMFGEILKLEEKNNDPLSLEFTSSTFAAGGPDSQFACPDNLAFDRRGNLWMTTDVSGKDMNRGQYLPFKNNSLFYIPLHGPNAGKAFRVATAPNDAELTGPVFSHDGRNLFLAVQHPGETSKALDQLTSHWPDGGQSVPRSSVVVISGPTLDKLVEGEAIKPLFEMPVLKRS